ncbi:IDEAL domain-containing protein [Sesbania bispinosa]|nr:IDEAL domain-containing protein [Sesbania bispinosa]
MSSSHASYEVLRGLKPIYLLQAAIIRFEMPDLIYYYGAMPPQLASFDSSHIEKTCLRAISPG